MNSREINAKLKNGMNVVIGYTIDGYKPLLDFVEDPNGNEIEEYDDFEVYNIISAAAVDAFIEYNDIDR